MSANAPGLSDDLLNCIETARTLRLSLSTLERMRLDGSGPPYIKLGAGKKRARVVYRRSDIDAWLLSCRRQCTSDRGTP